VVGVCEDFNPNGQKAEKRCLPSPDERRLWVGLAQKIYDDEVQEGRINALLLLELVPPGMSSPVVIII